MTRVRYTVGESVLCQQGQLIYEAKIQDIRKVIYIFLSMLFH